MAFNHSDTDRIAVYPNRPPKKTMGCLGNRRLLIFQWSPFYIISPTPLKPHHIAIRAQSLL